MTRRERPIEFLRSRKLPPGRLIIANQDALKAVTINDLDRLMKAVYSAPLLDEFQKTSEWREYSQQLLGEFPGVDDDMPNNPFGNRVDQTAVPPSPTPTCPRCGVSVSTLQRNQLCEVCRETRTQRPPTRPERPPLSNRAAFVAWMEEYASAAELRAFRNGGQPVYTSSRPDPVPAPPKPRFQERPRGRRINLDDG